MEDHAENKATLSATGGSSIAGPLTRDKDPAFNCLICAEKGITIRTFPRSYNTIPHVIQTHNIVGLYKYYEKYRQDNWEQDFWICVYCDPELENYRTGLVFSRRIWLAKHLLAKHEEQEQYAEVCRSLVKKLPLTPEQELQLLQYKQRMQDKFHLPKLEPQTQADKEIGKLWGKSEEDTYKRKTFMGRKSGKEVQGGAEAVGKDDDDKYDQENMEDDTQERTTAGSHVAEFECQICAKQEIIVRYLKPNLTRRHIIRTHHIVGLYEYYGKHRQDNWEKDFWVCVYCDSKPKKNRERLVFDGPDGSLRLAKHLLSKHEEQEQCADVCRSLIKKLRLTQEQESQLLSQLLEYKQRMQDKFHLDGVEAVGEDDNEYDEEGIEEDIEERATGSSSVAGPSTSAAR